MKILNKKGSQIGIVMSFTIFIISLIFIFSMLSPPTKVDKNKIYSLDFLEKNVIENVSEEVGIVLINDNGGTKSCLALNKNDLGYRSKEFIVKNKDWNEVPSGSAGSFIYLEKESNPFSRVYFSETSFNKSQNYAGTDCDSAKIYTVLTQRMIIEKRVRDLIEKYELNYSSLKSGLGVSNSDEFNILFYYENGTQIGEINDEVNSNVFAKTIQVKYLDEKGNKKIGELILKVW